MSKYKVVVYAICKNEQEFVDRWMDSVSEADDVYVLDTGSTDDTVKLLKKKGAHVTKEVIDPWRFDVARNRSLELVPEDADICVCMDLDEIILPGWRETLEEIWDPSITRLRYNYNWLLDEKGTPIVNFYIEKIHKRKGYKWTHPVHEVLTPLGEEVFATTDEITVNHYPDRNKSRGSYLPLLELSVEEDPMDDRNVHYLGREYMYYEKWNEAIDTLERHLSLPTATWKDERCASMRFIGRSYKELGRPEEAKMWFEKAIEEAPYLRDAYVERMILAYDLKEFDDVYKYGMMALEIKTHPKTYINETFSFNGTIEDLLSLYYYTIGDYENAIKYADIVLRMRPNDERVLKNREIFENAITKGTSQD